MLNLLSKQKTMTKSKNIMLFPAVALTTLIGGALAGYAGLAMAATDSATSTNIQTGTQPTVQTEMRPNVDAHQGGHVGANGVKEVLLTGDAATKATSAALAAVPGGTIDRVETDAEGAVYEAHVTKPDGSHVTVKMDQSFTVTSTEDGPGSR